MPSPSAVVRSIPVDRIQPGPQQARRRFDAETLRELAASIMRNGVIQPVVLRTAGSGYELLAGERRWRAAQLAGLNEIPALLRDDLSDDQAQVLGLIENLQRESLGAMETAAGLRELAERFSLTHEEVARRIGKSREYVSNFLRLLLLVPAVQALIADHGMSTGHAKALAGAPPQQQLAWARRCLEQGWSVRALEKQIALALRPLALRAATTADSETQRLERRISEHLGFTAAVHADASGRGELRLKFHSLDELDGLLQRLGLGAEL